MGKVWLPLERSEKKTDRKGHDSSGTPARGGFRRAKTPQDFLLKPQGYRRPESQEGGEWYGVSDPKKRN